MFLPLTTPIRSRDPASQAFLGLPLGPDPRSHTALVCAPQARAATNNACHTGADDASGEDEDDPARLAKEALLEAEADSVKPPPPAHTALQVCSLLPRAYFSLEPIFSSRRQLKLWCIA